MKQHTKSIKATEPQANNNAHFKQRRIH